MGKLFIFAVGGTGSRVIKSLMMLLAAGVEMNATEIIPIIVDPHKGNEDLKRTENLLRNYKNIFKSQKKNRPKGFFNTKVTTLKDLISSSEKLESSFSFSLKDLQNKTFKDYIGYATMNEPNRALASLLFSEKNLATEMDIGFVGNPNIGSVVLNQFKDSQEFTHFASNFEENDRIFIISSIFGGTGAAGFPIILKNIRNAQSNIDNHAFLKNGKIGAITILPYFGIEPGPDNRIKKAEFISKTKAALSYYEKNINDSVNTLYYLGDEKTRDYKHDPGENGQKNDAHFIELAAALSIVDFCEIPDEDLETVEGKPDGPIFKDFGVKRDLDTLTFNALGNDTQMVITKALSQYTLFHLFLKDYLKETVNKGRPFAERKAPKIDGAFLSSSFYKNYLTDFNKGFESWLNELARNRRAFNPFNLQPAKLSEFINDSKTKKGLFGQKDFGNKEFEKELNAAEQGHNFQTIEQKFMEIFFRATERILSKYYDNEYFK